jgi:hypothetical protein
MPICVTLYFTAFQTCMANLGAGNIPNKEMDLTNVLGSRVRSPHQMDLAFGAVYLD